MHKIDENSTPASHLGSWMKKALCSGAVLGLAMSMGTTSVAGSNKDKGEQFNEFTPVNRIAEMPVVRDERGKIDYRASYAKARAASVALATYVATMDESAAPLELPGGDWKLGGTSKDCIENLDCSDHEIDVAVLMIPSPEPIDPTDSAYM